MGIGLACLLGGGLGGDLGCGLLSVEMGGVLRCIGSVLNFGLCVECRPTVEMMLEVKD